MAWVSIVNFKLVGRGAAGTTKINGAREVQHDPGVVVAMARDGGVELPTRCPRQSCNPKWRVLTDDLQEMITHMTTSGKEKLKVTYTSTAGDKYVLPAVEAGGVEQITFRDAERGGSTTLYALLFNQIEDTSGQTYAAAMAIT